MAVTKRPRDGDVLLECGTGILSRLIKWITKSEVSHAGLVFILTADRLRLLHDYGQKIPLAWLGLPCVVESSARVRVSLLADRLREDSNISLHRYTRLSTKDRVSIVRAALGFVGQRYGVARLFVFAKDILLRTKSVRRMGLDVLVCSYLVAYPFAILGYLFGGKNPREATPKDILSTVETDGDWIQILKEGGTS